MRRTQNEQITIGSMFIAIVGVLILLDKQTGYFFADLSCVIVSSISTYYSALYGAKNGLKLNVSLCMLAIILGNITSYIYIPLGIICTKLTNKLLSRSNTKHSLKIMVAINMVLELIVCFAIYPLIGIPVTSQVSGVIDAITNLGYPAIAPWVAVISLLLTTLVIGTIRGYCQFWITNTLFKRFRGGNYELQR